jgi:hypothetical protein
MDQARREAVAALTRTTRHVDEYLGVRLRRTAHLGHRGFYK